jgi:hypothetical protein
MEARGSGVEGGEVKQGTVMLRRRGMPRAVIFAAVFVAGLAACAQADLTLRPVHPDEPVEYTYEQRFSLSNALDNLHWIDRALKSFRLLTEEVKGKISKKRLREINNTDWETQNLGFANGPCAIEGTLRKQDYLIKGLRYELAKEKMRAKSIGEEELMDAKRAFEAAEKAFQEFWNNFHIAD